MSKLINHCVIPLAGFGKRWIPMSHLFPKELLPIGNMPLFAYILKELVIAGISRVVLVVNSEKKPHFEKFINLIQTSPKLKSLKINQLKFELVEQNRLNGSVGLGAAVYSAKEILSRQNYFVLLLPDVLLSQSCFLKKMMTQFNSDNQPIIALNRVRLDEVMNYGIAELSGTEIHRINQLIEKPSKNKAPSNLAVLGRYILPSQIFESLEQSEIGVSGEIQITDAINQFIKQPQSLVSAAIYDSKTYDCGQVSGWLEANQKFNPYPYLVNSY